MENVDEIILHQLRSIGLDFDDGVQSLRDLTTDAVFKSISACLRIICGQEDLPKTLPPNMSQRYSTCGKLAGLIKGLGYRGDIGYQTILYCSETDIRNVLAFLIEKLPKEHAEMQTNAKLSYKDNVVKIICSELLGQLNRPWIPPRFRVLLNENSTQDVETVAISSTPLFEVPGAHKLQQSAPAEVDISGQARDNPFVLSASIIDSLALAKALESRIRSDKSDLSGERLVDAFKDDIRAAVNAAALLAKAAGKSGKGTAPKPSPRKDSKDAALAQSNAEEEERQRKEQVENMRQELVKLKEELNSLLTDVANLGRRRGELEREFEALSAEIERSQKEIETREVITNLLPNADENIAKLQAAINARRAKIDQLRTQWLELKTSLEAQLDKLTGGAELVERKALEKRLVEAEQDRELVVSEIAVKEDAIKSLEVELEKAPKDVSRSVYTKRIIDMIGNTKKQKNEIQKIAADTRLVQKEMNSLNEKVDRAFHIADEMVFRDSKRDESARKMYRFLAAMHGDFAATVVAVDDTGSLNRELDDTETQVEAEARKGWEERAQKIAADLQAMRQEQAQGNGAN